LRQSQITVALRDAAATEALGARVAAALLADARAPTTIALSGELGSGKTTLVAGTLAAFGHQGPVRSPTYTLIEPYVFAGRELLHCDLYRLESPQAVDELGLRDELTDANVLLVEWPERAGDRLGVADLSIELNYAGAARSATLSARTARGARLLELVALDLA
jgi:tRNA threonylcarbamoyladenosine biosynthesis protein TsaE